MIYNIFCNTACNQVRQAASPVRGYGYHVGLYFMGEIDNAFVLIEIISDIEGVASDFIVVGELFHQFHFIGSAPQVVGCVHQQEV